MPFSQDSFQVPQPDDHGTVTLHRAQVTLAWVDAGPDFVSGSWMNGRDLELEAVQHLQPGEDGSGSGSAATTDLYSEHQPHYHFGLGGE